MTDAEATAVLGVEGTRLLLDGRPFFFQGLSFFNALYNPAFNESEASRRHWLRTFRDHGVNALRVWCQWDYQAPRLYQDVGPDTTMYIDDGTVKDEPWERLAAVLTAANDLGFVIEVTLFSHEKQPNLPVEALERGARELTERLRPFRHVLLQVWNEDSTEILRLVDAVKAADPARLVTNSPGVANVLGDAAQNRRLDVLTPHTARRGAEPFWEVAPRQLAGLLAEYGKPVIDDEPARCGPRQFGGVPDAMPEQHIEQIKRVRAAGGYHTYHHDMFQYGPTYPETPPSGIPEPAFSPYHRQVFAWLREHRTW